VIPMERLDRGRQVMLSPDEIFAQDIGALWCSTAAACSVQTARSGSRPLGRLSQGGCVGHLGSIYVRPRRLGGPLWVDAANFDLDNQIAEFPLPAPATTLSSAHG
jgi:hypothetical protein